MVSKFSKKLIGQRMFDILDKTIELEKRGKKVIHFELGDPNFNTDFKIKNACIKALNDNLTHYTSSSGLPELRKQILFKEKKYFKNISSSNIQVCNANSLIYFSIINILNEKEEILIPCPYFPTYYSVSYSLGLKINYYNLNIQNSFSPSINEIKKIVETKKIKLIIFNNPGNPTGFKYEYSKIIDFINYCQKKKIYVLFDEVYYQTIFDGDITTILQYIKSLDYILCLRSFSKDHFMTGWRLGYILGDVRIIEKINITNQMINSCQPTFIQSAATQALKYNYLDQYKKYKEIIANRKDTIFEGLKNIEGVSVIKPNATYYIFPKLPKFIKDSETFCKYLLNKYNISVSPGIFFGHNFRNYIRMCFASVNIKDINYSIKCIEKSLYYFKK